MLHPLQELKLKKNVNSKILLYPSKATDDITSACWFSGIIQKGKYSPAGRGRATISDPMTQASQGLHSANSSGYMQQN